MAAVHRGGAAGQPHAGAQRAGRGTAWRGGAAGVVAASCTGPRAGRARAESGVMPECFFGARHGRRPDTPVYLRTGGSPTCCRCKAATQKARYQKSQTATDAKTAAPATARAGARKRASMIRSFRFLFLILPRPTPRVKRDVCAYTHNAPCVRAQVRGLTPTLPHGRMGDDPHRSLP